MIKPHQLHTWGVHGHQAVISCPHAAIKHAATPRCSVVSNAAGSSTAALAPSDQPAFIAKTYNFQATVFQHQHQQQPLQLTRHIRSCGSYTDLLALAHEHGKGLSAANITQLLHRAAVLARSATLQSNPAEHGSSTAAGRKAVAATAKGAHGDTSVAQQLVSSCLSMLLEVNEQVGAHELSSCMLSLAVLCGKSGPAAGTLSSSSSSSSSSLVLAQPRSRSAAGSTTSSSRQQQEQEQELLLLHQQQAAGGGSVVLQQLITPASNKALEQLMGAAAPHLQLQQLLGLMHSRVLPQAEQHQLVNVMYGLAALRLRPAPDVLQQLLRHTQQHMTDMLIIDSSSRSRSSSNSGGQSVRTSGQAITPKVVAQLLWAAATLQLQLPAAWIAAYWAVSSRLLQQFSAQDVANAAWAAAALQLQPPESWLSALQVQAVAVAGGMSGQALANTAWGLAVLQPSAAVLSGVLAQLLRCCLTATARLDGQNLANVAWAAARCLEACRTSCSVDAQAGAAVRQHLQQLLLSCKHLLPALQPHDWANLLWACGVLQLQPGQELFAQLWRKNPAGFSTSLNPHSSKPSAWCPQALASILWGCARLRVRPRAVWLQGVEAATVSLLPEFNSQQLATTLWAFSVWRCCPSAAWMQQYWARSGTLLQQLDTAIAAAAAAVPAAVAGQTGPSSPALASAGEVWLQLEYAVRHVVMVLQAAGRLGLGPPHKWAQTAVAAVAEAAALQHPLQQQQHRQAAGTLQPAAGPTRRGCLQPKTLTTAVHAIAMLQKQQADSSSSSQSACSEFSRHARQHVQQLLHQLGLADTVAAAASLGVPAHLSAMDVLLLLLALPSLQLQQGQVDTVAAQLLARGQQVLEAGGFSSSQLAQLAAAAAHRGNCHSGSSSCSSNAGSIGDTRRRGAGSAQIWHHGDTLSTNGSRPSNSRFVALLTEQLVVNFPLMSAVDVTRSLLAIEKLHANASVGKKQQRAGSTAAQQPGAAFVCAAGAAIGQQMEHMSPHMMAAAAASLARLGFCPDEAWLGALLLHSSCQWERCSNSDMVKLLTSLQALLHHQQQQQPQQHCQLPAAAPAAPSCRHGGAAATGRPTRRLLARNAAAAAAAAVYVKPSSSMAGPTPQQQQVFQWLQCWLAESEERLNSFTPRQLAIAAAALCKLTAHLMAGSRAAGGSGATAAAAAWHSHVRRVKQQQQQCAKVLLPPAWQQAYMSASMQGLQQLRAAQLVALAAAAVELKLRSWAGGHAWCAAVAAEAAARAAGNTKWQALPDNNLSSSSSSSPLQVHHVGLLAVSFRQLAYQVPWQHKQALLQYVLDACCEVGSAGSSRRASVKPAQLLQLLVLLPRAGWMPDRDWVEHVKVSLVGQQLQLKMQKRPGGWEAVWAGLKVWDDQHKTGAMPAAAVTQEVKGQP